MHDRVTEFDALLTETRAAHHKLFDAILHTRGAVNSGKMSPGDLVDLGFLLREISKLSEDTEKECNKLQKDAARVTCLLWLVVSTANPDVGDTVRGELATGSPSVKTIVQLPKRGTDEYRALMSYLKVPEDLAEEEIVKIHWPAFQERIFQDATQGKPLPPGIDASKTFDDYQVRLTARRSKK